MIILNSYLIININYIIMIILNYDKNEKFKLDVPKLNGPILHMKPKNDKNSSYIVIASIFIIGFLFNRGLKN